MLSLLIGISTPVLSQQAVAVPKSSWIESVAFDLQAKPEPDQAGSYYDLLIDEQESAVTHEDYYHYAYRILSAEGVQRMASLSIAFDPSYQKLRFHELVVYRDGQRTDRLPAPMQVLRRETEMDRYLYDGTVTATIEMKDIRVGDVIEYSYTIVGDNPVFKGHFSRRLTLDESLSYEKCFKQLVTDANHPLQIKSLGDVAHTEVQQGGLRKYQWHVGRHRGMGEASNAPSWYTLHPYVVVSDFKSWADVIAWAAPLFEITSTDEAAIQKWSKEKFTAESDEAYAMQVIRFVQDEIRYLGFESGINSHQPHSPKQIFEQRFGDCKDKSLLLVSLLRARGIEAYPMLVNTYMKERLDDRLPAANIFDHCVVQIVMDGEFRYVDPTISHQGGDLKHLSFPDYKRGLVINLAHNSLTSLPSPTAASVHEVQTFDIPTVREAEAVRLTVITTYTGGEADDKRGELAGNDLASIQQTYRSFYANLYQEIKSQGSLKVEDDRAANVIKIEEQYVIPHFWQKSTSDSSKLLCEFYPQILESMLNVSATVKERTTPLRLRYPVNFTHDVVAHLPEVWDIPEEETEINSAFYRYKYHMRSDGTDVLMTTSYQTLRDHIPVDFMATYVEDHKKMWANISYQLTYSLAVQAANQNPIPGVILSVVSAMLAIAGCWWLYYRYDPVPVYQFKQGKPIGGWLALLAVGVSLRPWLNLMSLSEDPTLFEGTSWTTWFASGRYDVGILNFLSHLHQIVAFVMSVLMVVLFFKRRSSFPKLYVLTVIISIVMEGLKILAVVRMDHTIANYVGWWIFSIVVGVLWSGYLLYAEESRETFVIRAPNFYRQQEELH